MLAATLVGCGDPAPLTLEVDPSITPMGDWSDKSEFAKTRLPWDNFATRDSLNDQFEIRVKPPSMMLVAQRDRFQEDPVKGILQQGSVNFWTVAELFRTGALSRDGEEETVAEIRRRIAEHPLDPVYKANAIVGLIHIGFDASAIEMIDEYKDEEWFSTQYDVNRYAGSLFFRYRDYERAVPFLEAATELHPDDTIRMWLALALAGLGDEESLARAKELFPIGEHVGGGDPEQFHFVDSSDKWGFRRWQLAGALSFLDFDNDTHLDLVANGAYSNPEFYRFDPNDGFTLTDTPAMEDIYNTPPGMAAADFDNDGFTDVYMTQAAWFSAGPNRLLRNAGGEGWEDASNRGDAGLMEQNSCGVSTLDFNRDGLVDLAVTGTMGGTMRLLKNVGGMEFEDVSEEVGILDLQATAVGLAIGDVNDDGFDDIFVNSFSPPHGGLPGSGFSAPNQLYIAQGDGTFVEEAAARGIGAEESPMGFGSWMFDYDNDGDLDIMAANFARPEDVVIQGLQEELELREGYQRSPLYKNDGTGHFTNVSDSAGFQPASFMGAQYIDLELDGDLDVVLGPGSHPLQHMQPIFIYRNDGNDQFTNIAPVYDPDLYGKFHGTAFADVDRDGDPDLYLNNGGVMLSDRWIDVFLENTTEGNNWIHLGFEGTTSNRSAIGTKVTIEMEGRVLRQDVRAGTGFSSTNSPYLIFGLAQAEATGPITIRWPDGSVQTVPSLAANQAVVITEGSDEYRRIY